MSSLSRSWLYEEATAENHSFLYINLLVDRRDDMFYKDFEYRVLPLILT